jgi:peptidoglycan/LPS O-acetylase OafA/YrhL
MSNALASSSPAGAPAWLTRGRIPSLDGLRALAVLLVFYEHAMVTSGFPQVARLPRLNPGPFGVQIFFVISGFLITTLMLRQQHQTGRLDLGRFYRARFLKILPPYAALLGAIALLAALGLARVPARDWLAAGTFTMNWTTGHAWEVAHAWSLSIEEHFYLVWPFLFAVSAVHSRRAAWAAVALCPAWRCLAAWLWPSAYYMASFWTIGRIDGIAVGCLLAFAAWEPRHRARLDALAADGWRTLGFLLALVLLRAATYLSWRFFIVVSPTADSLVLAVLLWTVVRRPDTQLGGLLNRPWLQALGLASYSLYLWQQLFLDGRRTGFLCQFPQNVLLALAAGWLSYQLIEKPIVQLKARETPRPLADADSQVEATRVTVHLPVEDDGRQPSAHSAAAAPGVASETVA